MKNMQNIYYWAVIPAVGGRSSLVAQNLSIIWRRGGAALLLAKLGRGDNGLGRDASGGGSLRDCGLEHRGWGALGSWKFVTLNNHFRWNSLQFQAHYKTILHFFSTWTFQIWILHFRFKLCYNLQLKAQSELLIKIQVFITFYESLSQFIKKN